MRHRAVASRTAAGGGGGFNPQTDITWHSLFWAEGTAMQGLAYADAASVTTWPNETAEGDATEATNPPAYSASTASLNGKPAVVPTSTQFLTIGTLSSISQPMSIVAVSVAKNEWSDRSIVTGSFPQIELAAPRDRRGVFIRSDSSTLGTGNDYYPAADTPAAIVGLWNGASSKIYFNGALAASGSLNSTTISTGHKIFDNYDRPLALLGVYEGDITADGEWANFNSWAETHYGLTIA